MLYSHLRESNRGLRVLFHLGLQVLEQHLVGVVLVNRIPVVFFGSYLGLQTLDLSGRLLDIHELAGQILTKSWIHRVNPVEPEVRELVGIHALANSLGFLGVICFGRPKTDMSCHLGSIGLFPFLITHSLDVVGRKRRFRSSLLRLH